MNGNDNTLFAGFIFGSIIQILYLKLNLKFIKKIHLYLKYKSISCILDYIDDDIDNNEDRKARHLMLLHEHLEGNIECFEF